MQLDKYAVATFSEVIVDNIKKFKPKFSMKKVVYQSNGVEKRFKQEFSIYLGTIIYEEFLWHFTATSHSKDAIDGLGGTLKRRMRVVTRSRKIDPHTAEEFLTFAKNVCPKITVLYISQEEINLKKQKFDNIWEPDKKEIKTIKTTRKTHFVEKVSPSCYVIGRKSEVFGLAQCDFPLGTPPLSFSPRFAADDSRRSSLNVTLSRRPQVNISVRCFCCEQCFWILTLVHFVIPADDQPRKRKWILRVLPRTKRRIFGYENSIPQDIRIIGKSNKCVKSVPRVVTETCFSDGHDPDSSPAGASAGPVHL
ncbi:uncharacterized protein NPIL_105021 [Nephila pilipes]|uniref:Uncharacterized protein n=1 Tax=Nephila pilipes TaxID=299642 RepID=A0A8X6N5I9_NEPPI|nr:uncharacterized protein NPIL_105021 [Nephila pilipes]